MKAFKYSIKPLVDALEEYDRTAPERQSNWTNASSNEDVLAAVRQDNAAIVKVQDAFHCVTKDRNSLQNCRRCDVDFIRRMVKWASLQDQAKTEDIPTP